ncbi:MAG: hypothetical protein L0312_26760 [Acidobacteria bacterium]|nr:hypothetical protein [Acidobacteriota bacterium]
MTARTSAVGESVTQPGLFPEAQRRAEKFDGATFDAKRDGARLTRQLDRVREIMQDKKWHTLAELVRLVGGASEAGVSARIRDLKKPRFGGHVIEKQFMAETSQWRYRMER